VGEDAPRRLENPPTRAEAEAELLALLTAEAAAGRRTLVGFDFPFGYPEGFAETAFGAPGWRAVWGALCELVQDRAANFNNRLAVAAEINRRLPGDGPYWGHPPSQRHEGLPALKPRDADPALPEWRAAEAEARARGAQPKSCWQLNGAGAVGGQVLTGIPAVARLRGALDGAAQVWPFETGLAAPDAVVVFAEIYPSLVDLDPEPQEVKDAAQVRATAAHFAALDVAGRLAPLFAAPGAEAGVRPAVALEEAWILGLELFGAPPPPEPEPAPSLDLPALEAALRAAVAEACGRAEAGEALTFANDPLAAAAQALAAGAPFVADGPMTAAGLAHASGAPEVLQPDADPEADGLAALAPSWAGAVIVLGDDPASAAALAEALASPDASRPAAVLSLGAGLTGAAAAKETLAALDLPLVQLPGSEGGPAAAVAAARTLLSAVASLSAESSGPDAAIP
jgi:precorrin-8X/cobalt-precorrin-8 methylmutase